MQTIKYDLIFFVIFGDYSMEIPLVLKSLYILYTRLNIILKIYLLYNVGIT